MADEWTNVAPRDDRRSANRTDWQTSGSGKGGYNERTAGKGGDRGGFGERSGGKGDDRGAGKGQRSSNKGGGKDDRYRREDREGGNNRDGKGRKGGKDDYRTGSGGGSGNWNREDRTQQDRKKVESDGRGFGFKNLDESNDEASVPQEDSAPPSPGTPEPQVTPTEPTKPKRTPLWMEYADVDGMPYYYNSRTGLCQWERPAELEPPKKSAQESGASASTFADLGSAQDRSREGFGRRDGGGFRDRDADRDDRRKGFDGGRDGGGGKGGGKNRDGGKGNDRRRGGDGGGGRGRGKGGGNQQPQDSDFGPPGCNLFVFHLPDDWADEDLHEYFAPHGNVVSAKVMKELGTGRSRGFGFVSYEDRISAATAIKKMQGYKILGKRLKVEFKKGEGEDNPHVEDDEGTQKKSYPDDERLIGYLRAISAKNVVQSLKETEGGGAHSPRGGDDLGLLPEKDEDDGGGD